MKHIQLQARNDEFNHPNREWEHDVEGKISNPSHFGELQIRGKETET
jgi:hypothetical protein